MRVLVNSLVVLLFGSAATPIAFGGESDRARSKRPNIVIIVTDDLRDDMFGFAGHACLETPAIDRLADEGTVFRNAFVITPQCAPSRATFFTGRWNHQHGVMRNGLTLPADAETFVQYLNEAGYETGFVGKYGLAESSQPRHGFQHWVSYRKLADGGLGEYYKSGTFNYNVDGVYEHKPGFSTDSLTEFATDWIRRRGETPFFLMLSIKNPHVPYWPPPRHQELFTEVGIPLPASYADPIAALPTQIRGDRNEAPLLVTSDLERNFKWARRNKPGDPVESMVRGYWQMVPSIDDCVGRVYDALRECGLLDHTVLMLTSDNGMLLGEHGIIGKELAYDPSIRVPLIMRGPGVPEGGTVDAQVLNLDFAPTFLDLAGAETPAAMSGRSMAPLLSDPAAPWRSDWLIVGRATGKGGPARPRLLGVRSARWKYVRYLHGELEEQLFDLEDDPGERRNLTGEAMYAEQLGRQRARLRVLLREAEMPEDWWKASGE